MKELKAEIKDAGLKSVTGPLVEILKGTKELSMVVEALLSQEMAFAFIVGDKADHSLVQGLRDKLDAPAPLIFIDTSIISYETTILHTLEGIAEKLNLKVSYENLRKLRVFSKGGLYRFKDDRTVLIEKSLILSDKIDTLADALAQFDLEEIFIPPAVRKILAGKTRTPTDESSAETAAAPAIHPGDHSTSQD